MATAPGLTAKDGNVGLSNKDGNTGLTNKDGNSSGTIAPMDLASSTMETIHRPDRSACSRAGDAGTGGRGA